MRARACRHCERTVRQVRLMKCVICHEHFCHACEFRRYGKKFCSKICAEVFFFGGEDEAGG